MDTNKPSNSGQSRPGGFRQGGSGNNRDRRDRSFRGGGRPGGFSGGDRGEGGFNRTPGGPTGPRRPRRDFLEETKAQLREAHGARDLLLSHTVKAVFEVNRSANLLYETLTEWYAVYFPELRVSEPATFAKLVQAISREDLKASDISSIVGEQKAQELESKAKTSIGAKLSKEDLSQMTKLAHKLEELYSYRTSLEEYQAALAQEIAPNISLLAGPDLAAKLIAKAGSLRKLALMPASTVQVIGAEKALFKHLRNGSSPPKHGLIFQHVSIAMSPKNLRGKIARSLATKLAIASKADAFSKHMIAEKLKLQFEERVKALKG
jgi:nucleolar protein 56